MGEGENVFEVAVHCEYTKCHWILNVTDYYVQKTLFHVENSTSIFKNAFLKI